MAKIIDITKRCRNSEAEIEFDMRQEELDALINLTEPAERSEDIILRDRILNLMEDPGATDTNMWADFWERDNDAWVNFVNISTARSARQIVDDWEHGFLSSSKCRDKYQAWEDMKKQPEFGTVLNIVNSALYLMIKVQQAAEEQAQKEKDDE